MQITENVAVCYWQDCLPAGQNAVIVETQLYKDTFSLKRRHVTPVRRGVGLWSKLQNFGILHINLPLRYKFRFMHIYRCLYVFTVVVSG